MKVLLVIVIVWLIIITCLFVEAFNTIDWEIDKVYDALLEKEKELNRRVRELEWRLRGEGERD